MSKLLLSDRLSLKLLEQIPLGIVLIDQNGVVVWANEKQEEFTNINSDSLIGESFYDYAGFRDSGLDEILRSVVENGVKWSNPEGNASFHHQAASRFRTEFQPIYDGDEIIGAAILFWDITNQVAATAEAEKARKQLNAVLALTDDDLFFIDRAFLIQKISRTLLDRHQMKNSSKVIGAHCYHVFFQRNEPCLHCPAIRSFEKGITAECTTEKILPHNQKYTSKSVPIRDSQNNIFQVVVRCLPRDMEIPVEVEPQGASERVELENKLDELQALNQFNVEILNTIPHKALVVDRDYNLLYVNHIEDNGKKVEDIVGKSLFDVFPDYDFEDFRDSLRQCMDTGETTEVFQTIENILADDETIKHSIRRLQDFAGLEAFLILSEKVKSEYVDKQKICAEKYDSLHRFAKKIIHDIRNPLSTLLTRLDLLMKPDAEESSSVQFFEEEVKSIQKQANRIVKILEDLEAIQVQSREDLVLADVGTILDRASVIAELNRPRKDVHLKLEVSSDMPRLLCYESRLERAFNEILMNALEAMDKPGEVVVTAEYIEEESGYYLIKVTDTGRGIDEKSLTRIFDPFYSTKEKKGAGLGLTIAFAVISEHAGKIKISSKLNEGTTVSIFLPRRQKVLE